MEIFPASLDVLERSMDLRMVQQRVTAANLANIDTPGYTAQELDFEASLRSAMNGETNPAVIAPSTAAPALDGNNVDLEHELSVMSRNRVLYSVTSQIVAAKFRQLGTIFDKENT